MLNSFTSELVGVALYSASWFSFTKLYTYLTETANNLFTLLNPPKQSFLATFVCLLPWNVRVFRVLFGPFTSEDMIHSRLLVTPTWTLERYKETARINREFTKHGRGHFGKGTQMVLSKGVVIICTIEAKEAIYVIVDFLAGYWQYCCSPLHFELWTQITTPPLKKNIKSKLLVKV